MITIVPQRPADAPIIEQLLDDAFEPERRLRPAYSLRGNAEGLLADAGITPTLRAEDIVIEGFCSIARAFAARNDAPS